MCHKNAETCPGCQLPLWCTEEDFALVPQCRNCGWWFKCPSCESDLDLEATEGHCGQCGFEIVKGVGSLLPDFFQQVEEPLTSLQSILADQEDLGTTIMTSHTDPKTKQTHDDLPKKSTQQKTREWIQILCEKLSLKPKIMLESAQLYKKVYSKCQGDKKLGLKQSHNKQLCICVCVLYVCQREKKESNRSLEQVAETAAELRWGPGRKTKRFKNMVIQKHHINTFNTQLQQLDVIDGRIGRELADFIYPYTLGLDMMHLREAVHTWTSRIDISKVCSSPSAMVAAIIYLLSKKSQKVAELIPSVTGVLEGSLQKAMREAAIYGEHR